jgi:protein-S-isoprenylcysteine O-methyltransferase Ste14
MRPGTIQQGQVNQSDADGLVRLGGWLFRHRSIIPVPISLALLIIPAGEAAPSARLPLAGAGVVVLGEALRLWGVHHIGVISRTRSDRLGPLITTGPFAHVRNPLYLGNIALWTGFAICARLLWLAPVITAVLALEYHAIVRWEEQLLAARLGGHYDEYRRAVPRWIPSMRRVVSTSGGRWRDTFFSERGTLLAIAAGFLLLWLKARF